MEDAILLEILVLLGPTKGLSGGSALTNAGGLLMNPLFSGPKGTEILENRRETAMSRRCELTGKGPLVGNNVSHANNKTKRIYRPNLQIIALASELLGNSYKLKISMNALRSVDRNGGLDPFILKSKDSVLSPKALRLKRAIAKKAAAKAA